MCLGSLPIMQVVIFVSGRVVTIGVTCFLLVTVVTISSMLAALWGSVCYLAIISNWLNVDFMAKKSGKQGQDHLDGLCRQHSPYTTCSVVLKNGSYSLILIAVSFAFTNASGVCFFNYRQQYGMDWNFLIKSHHIEQKNRAIEFWKSQL